MPLEDPLERPISQVCLIRGQAIGALAPDLNLQAGWDPLDFQAVVEGESEAQGIKTRAEVGGRRGDADSDMPRHQRIWVDQSKLIVGSL